MKNLLLFLTGLVLFGCSSPSTKDAIEESAPAENEMNCFQFANEQDTISFSYQKIAGDSIIGHLEYNFYEKDDNSGAVKGVLKDEVILGSYTFVSEGTTSVREVAFRLTGDGVVEGFGEMHEEAGAVCFKNPDKIDFSSSIKLGVKSCQ